ncbi:MAG: hypothetical protein ACI8P0_005367, partial [Planctomycetaceae bacterium]
MTAEKIAESSIDPDWSTVTMMCHGRLFLSAAKKNSWSTSNLPVSNGTAGDFAEISAAANLAGMAAFVFVMRAGEKS